MKITHKSDRWSTNKNLLVRLSKYFMRLNSSLFWENIIEQIHAPPQQRKKQVFFTPRESEIRMCHAVYLERFLYFFFRWTERNKKTFNLTSFTVETQEGICFFAFGLSSALFRYFSKELCRLLHFFLPFKKKPIDDYTPISKRHTDIPMNGLQFFFL